MISTRFKLKVALFFNFFVFAMLLNSVGTAILQVQRNFNVSTSAAGTLEAFLDMSIVAASFFAAAIVARIGYRTAMLASLAFMTMVCALIPLVPSFATIKLLFAAAGASFAFVKISVYATVGLLAPDRREHASLMSFLESVFMVGVFAGYFVFGAFVDNVQPRSTSWLNVYFLLAGLSLIAFLLLLDTPFDGAVAQVSSARPADFFRLLRKSVVLAFLVSALLDVLVSKIVMSWLPSYNNLVLRLPASLSVQMTSILAASTALGRFLSGILLRRFSWLSIVMVCLLAAALMVAVFVPLANHPSAAITGWRNAPLAAFLFPVIGLFLAPIYPVINSAVLTALPRGEHASMASLSMIFSGIGGTAGTVATGWLFHLYGGQTAFLCSLVPMGALLVCLIFFERMRNLNTMSANA
jgi:fucose permease